MNESRDDFVHCFVCGGETPPDINLVLYSRKQKNDKLPYFPFLGKIWELRLIEKWFIFSFYQNFTNPRQMLSRWPQIARFKDVWCATRILKRSGIILSDLKHKSTSGYIGWSDRPGAKYVNRLILLNWKRFYRSRRARKKTNQTQKTRVYRLHYQRKKKRLKRRRNQQSKVSDCQSLIETFFMSLFNIWTFKNQS